MTGSAELKLDELLNKGGGYLLTADVVKTGISKPTLAAFVRNRNLVRVAHGVYFSEDAWEDDLFLIGTQNKAVCFSHETALYLHHLMEREPSEYSVTIRNNYNGTSLRKRGICVYRVRDDLFLLGMTEVESNYGHFVKAYDRERTICDIVSHKDKMDIQVFQSAMKEYMSLKDKKLRNLMRYAAVMGIEDKLRMYTEVML